MADVDKQRMIAFIAEIRKTKKLTEIFLRNKNRY